jgi:fatty-acyl-CoA synthase
VSSIKAVKPSSRTIGDLIKEQAKRYPEREFTVGGGQRFTYAEVYAASERYARSLIALGIGRGDKVGILMGNRPDWLLLHFAAARIGAVVVGVNTWSTARELEYYLRHSDCRVLFTVERLLKNNYVQLLREIGVTRETFPLLEHVVVWGEAQSGMMDQAAFLAAGEAISADQLAALAAAVEPTDLALLLYTSGSTSLPKGVMIQHAGLIENMWEIGERLHMTPDDSLWLATPLFYGFGCENALYAVATHGSRLVLQEFFEPGEALRLLEAERCTVFYGMPNMVHALKAHADFPTRDITSLRTGITMGTPDQYRALAATFLPEVTQAYGMTELYGNACVADVSSPIDIRATSGGKPLGGVDLRIFDPVTGEELPHGSVGEIRVKGHVTLGYYKDPERTAESFDARGYFRTGDLGVKDAEGNVTFRGRMKEFVKTGGINVSPIEVEEYLLGHPDVSEAYVVGVPDDVRGEALAAVVVGADPENPPSATALTAYCREGLAAYKTPHVFRFITVPEVPRTTTGKVQKNRMVDLFEPASKSDA